ncbi:MAG: glycosyltransferase family 39 protein [Polyangiaceae bacterium]|nr:glycosyltransferase family 39 protein [Polyangiaceae bacterium]
MADPTSRLEPSSSDAPLPSSDSGADDAGVADAAPSSSWGSWLPLAIAIGLPVLFFFVIPPLTRAGLWDPNELNVADLARRIAINLHGATNLALQGADNSLPHLNDLGRPQLPFTSIALGFKFFGLHEWAGRAPLGIWGLAGVVVTYGFVARLVDRRAGLFSAIALTTMPLYFVQARTMLGDIVTMSAFAMAFGGLLVAMLGGLHADVEPTSAVGGIRAIGAGERVGWLVVGIVGLVSGYFTRGGVLGVAAPALSVGLTFGVLVVSGHVRFDYFALITGIGSLIAGGIFAWLGLSALASSSPADLNPLVGAMIKTPAKYPTFDFAIGHIAEALAPWSAFIPFAFGRLFWAPTARAQEREQSVWCRESAARTALLMAAGVALFAHGWLAARTDLIAFAAPAVLAAGCGIALCDYERGAHPSLAVGVGTAVLLALLHHELHNMPEKAFNVFAVAPATFPESFKPQALTLWWVVLGGFAAVVLLTFVERYRPWRTDTGLVARVTASIEQPSRKPFDPQVYLRVLCALRDAWDGMLSLAYLASVAGASLAGLVVWVGGFLHARWLPVLSSPMHNAVLNAWWVVAFVPLAIVFGALFWCDVWLWTFEGARPLSHESLKRGFLPFKDLLAHIRSSGLTFDNGANANGVAGVALFIVAPLMFLQVPAIVFKAMTHAGVFEGQGFMRALAALLSGVVLFLVLGVIGDVLRGSRAAFLVGWAAVVVGILCVSYYPALANQLSPKEIFESYQRLRQGTEPLALFGVGGRTAAYYAGGQPLILRDTTAAHEWLMASEPSSRRFIAARSEELAHLNHAYRERTTPRPIRQNLPVLDARSSQILLVASSLRGGEQNDNPLDRIVLSHAPNLQHKLDVNLEDKLMVLGYDITDTNLNLVQYVVAGKKFHIRTYFKVLMPISSEWEMFIHIDGGRKRHNGDHKLAEGKYPLSLWLKDDVIVDDYEFTLEPNFGPGNYSLYLGLFAGEVRMKVKSGPADSDNRISGGSIRVQ